MDTCQTIAPLSPIPTLHFLRKKIIEHPFTVPKSPGAYLSSQMENKQSYQRLSLTRERGARRSRSGRRDRRRSVLVRGWLYYHDAARDSLRLLRRGLTVRSRVPAIRFWSTPINRNPPSDIIKSRTNLRRRIKAKSILYVTPFTSLYKLTNYVVTCTKVR